MRLKLLALYLIFFDFLAYTVYVVWTEGYFGFVPAAMSSPWNIQIFFDLVVACVIIGSWMVVDGSRRGKTAWPYVLAIPFLGSLPPLVYLIVREHQINAEDSAGLAPA